MVMRLISSAVGIPVAIFFVFIGGGVYTAAVIALALLSTMEMGKMLKRIGVKEMQPFLYSGAVLFPLLFSFEPSWLPAFLTLYVFTGVLLAISRYPDFTLNDLAVNFFSVLYIAFGFAHFILLRRMDQGIFLVGYALSVIWMTDIGSFFVGLYLGKRPFFSHISPNKTVEGAIGGLITGVAGGLIFCVWANRLTFFNHMGFLIFLTPLLSAAGQFGDLFESSIKRLAKVKDSSQLIPGHGGILDRFDGALWVIPLLYHILQIRLRIFM